MSIEAMNAVAKMPIEPSGRKFVAMALANFADENWTCFPSIGKISEWTSQAPKTVRDHIDALEDAGFIQRERTRRDDGTLGVYRYFIQRQFSPVADFASGGKGQTPVADFATHNHQYKPSTNTKPVARARGTFLQDDWEPSQADLDFALETGWQMEHVRIEAMKFRNYWTNVEGARGRKKNWHRTWQNWVLSNLPHKRGPSTPPPKPQPVKEHRNADFIKALAEIARNDPANPNNAARQPDHPAATPDAGLQDRGNGRPLVIDARPSEWRDF